MKKLLAIVILASLFGLTGYCESTNEATASKPLVEWLPKNIETPSTNAWAAILGKYAKKVSIGASDSFRHTGGGKAFDFDHAPSVSALYEFWQQDWVPKEGWKIDTGIGVLVTYVPQWQETDVGAGLSVSVFKLAKLQAIVDKTVVSTVTPRLLFKGVLGVQAVTDEIVLDKSVHGRGVIALNLPFN